MRVGIGYDIHRFEEGRRLVLGGVEIPGETGLAGHSDADVLLHAIIDAFLGAAGFGDIGQHFPPGEPRWKDASSVDLLARTLGLIHEAGFRVENIDATVIAEGPRLAPHIPVMRERVAQALDLGPGRVNVKATTSEGLGALGRGEGIAAMAVVLVEETWRAYHSGCGWPSFTETISPDAVELIEDRSHGKVRTEVRCARCGSHLGHVFDDGPRDRGGLRYCMNSVALELEPEQAG